MSRSKRSRDNPKLPPFVAMTWEVLNSKAYIDLPSSAAKALPYFYGKYGRKYRVVLVGNREIVGDFEFSYEEAVRLGFAKRTFARVIDELIEKGFIDIAGYGGLRGFCKSYNKFRPSHRWQRYGQPNFEVVSRYPSEPT